MSDLLTKFLLQTEPRGVIYRLTSSYPNHPASSWYYPTVKKLPPIASFQFTKVVK